MDLIKTLSNTFQALATNFKDRVTSPIGGTFLTAWIIVNWKLVYYFIFNNDKVIDKITYITGNFSDPKYTICLPVAISIGYILFYPTLANISSFVWAFTDKWSKTLSAKYIENKVPLFEDDKRNILNIMREQAIKFEEEKKELNNQIDSLNAALTNFEKPYESKTENNSDKTVDNDNKVSIKKDIDSNFFSKLNTEKGKYLLNENMAKLFFLEMDYDLDRAELNHYCAVFKSVIKASPSGFSPKAIRIGTSNLDINQVAKYLNRLSNCQLISKDFQEDNEYILSDEGKKLLFKIDSEL
tara:strand:- start:3579 stop:4472 length:894 start_codon:yes stop_codon:yes gene_type:complete